MGKRVQRSLFERLCDSRTLGRAWRSLNKANRLSAGLRGPTIDQFEQGLRGNLRSLAAELRAGTFEFAPVKGVPVPKGGGKYRPIRVQEIKDRIVCKAIAGLIAPSLTKKLHLDHPSSFGYQPGRGVRDALHKVIALHREGRPIVVEADIERFFDSINRDRLLNELVFPALPDSSLRDLVRKAVEQQVGNLDDFERDMQALFEDAGVAQGSALSPLFANVYLAPLDAALEQRGHRMVRYADDFVVMCKDVENAADALQTADKVLTSLGLALHPEKTQVRRVSEGFSFLGVHFNGVRLVPEFAKQARFKERINEITEVDGGPNQSLLGILTRTNRFLEGWAAAFTHADVLHIATDLEEHIDHRLGVAIAKLGWRTGRKDRLTPDQRDRSGVPRLMTVVEALRGRWPAKHSLFKELWSPTGAAISVQSAQTVRIPAPSAVTPPTGRRA